VSRKPDLIVPIRDRRQRKRYLTLKNFGIFVGVLIVVFVGISIRSELRGTSVDYGRLMQRELPSDPGPVKPVEVVTEAAPAPVPDVTHADPLLLAPMGREQWLQGDPQATATAAATATTVTALPAPTFGVMPRAEASVASGETRVAIVGSATEGVTVVKAERTKPQLSGGFGRQ
jgi:hypothetical protein